MAKPGVQGTEKKGIMKYFNGKQHRRSPARSFASRPKLIIHNNNSSGFDRRRRDRDRPAHKAKAKQAAVPPSWEGTEKKTPGPRRPVATAVDLEAVFINRKQKVSVRPGGR